MRIDQPSLLILAGKRDGKVDPFAESFGVTHKCVVPVAGKPMIEWVLDAAEATGWPVMVSLDAPVLLDEIGAARRMIAEGRLLFVKPDVNIVESVLAAARQADFPLMITTADNVLVTAEALAGAHRGARAAGAAVMVALARKEDILAAHPDGQRRFYAFRDGEYSNCNLFWIAGPNALQVAETFREGGQFAKHPRRIIRAFGILNLIRFRYRLTTLGGLFANLSRRFGTLIVPHIFDDGALAIDVDNARTHGVAEELLAARAAKPEVVAAA